MGFVSCDAEGLQKEKVDYLGINGSATYACSFNDVFIPMRISFQKMRELLLRRFVQHSSVPNPSWSRCDPGFDCIH